MATLGPQAERTQWVNRNADLPLPAERESLVMDAMADKRLYEQELARAHTENVFLKDNVQRLSKELKALQLQYPAAAAGLSRADVDGQPDLPPWVMSADVVSPLLAAYDARMQQELETLVKSQKGELESLTQRTETLISENERLRENQIQDIDALVQRTEASNGLGGAGARELLDEMNERVNILMAENALLADQTANLGRELDRASADLEERETQVRRRGIGSERKCRKGGRGGTASPAR
ncbi:unnamed protein product [Phaeothamnion confervicola]